MAAEFPVLIRHSSWLNVTSYGCYLVRFASTLRCPSYAQKKKCLVWRIDRFAVWRGSFIPLKWDKKSGVGSEIVALGMKNLQNRCHSLQGFRNLQQCQIFIQSIALRQNPVQLATKDILL